MQKALTLMGPLMHHDSGVKRYKLGTMTSWPVLYSSSEKELPNYCAILSETFTVTFLRTWVLSTYSNTTLLNFWNFELPIPSQVHKWPHLYYDWIYFSTKPCKTVFLTHTHTHTIASLAFAFKFSHPKLRSRAAASNLTLILSLGVSAKDGHVPLQIASPTTYPYHTPPK